MGPGAEDVEDVLLIEYFLGTLYHVLKPRVNCRL